MTNLYSEKEIAIFNGLIDLIKSGANPYLIKVQDIADAANIGKGTVYDYFKSKEEVIAKAILYSINLEIESSFSRIRNKNLFRDKFFELLGVVVECLQNNLSTFNMLISLGGALEFYEYLRDDQYDLSLLTASVNQVIGHILQQGCEEGVISLQEDSFYKRMAFHGAVAAFSQYVSRLEGYPGISIEEAKEVAYKLLLKTLN